MNHWTDTGRDVHPLERSPLADGTMGLDTRANWIYLVEAFEAMWISLFRQGPTVNRPRDLTDQIRERIQIFPQRGDSL